MDERERESEYMHAMLFSVCYVATVNYDAKGCADIGG